MKKLVKSRVVVKEIDKGLKALRQTLKTLKEGDSYVKAGVLGEDKKNRRKGEWITNVELAAIHEYGAPGAGIPERSFMRSTFDDNRFEYIGMLNKMVRAIYEQRVKIKTVLGTIGAKMAADMKNRIAEGIPPPNSPEVFMRKLLGSKYAEQRFNETGATPKPLVDTGQLVSSITWAVVMSGEKKGEE